jgi:tetratricopeptide (TPR) repeat protein
MGVLILVPLYAQSLAQPPDYLAQGMKALDANQPAVAEPLFRKALDANPSDLPANFNLALVLGMENKDSDAVAAWRKTLELKPGLYEADLNLGILLTRDHQPDDALPLLKEAAEAKPSEFRPRFYYGEALFDAGQFADAESQFRAAITANPKSAGADLGLARSLLKQEKFADAEAGFRAAATLDPSFRNALLELAAEYDRTGHSEEAIAILREFPNNPTASKRMAELLVATGNAKGAIPALEATVAQTPTTKNQMALIDAYRDAGMLDKMLAQLKIATESDPENFELHMSYGRNLRDHHQYRAAAAQFQGAARLKPDSVEAMNELAGVLILAEEYDAGLAALDRVHALGKEIPGDFYLRAITLDKLRRDKPALAAYKQFLAAAGGKYPDDEFRARQRVIILERKLGK